MSIITLTADYGYTNYRVDGLADGTVIDASGASWIQDNDASDGQSNPYPFMVYDSANLVLKGGTIDGNINQTDAWRDVYDEGNSAGIRTEGTPNVVISDWRISNTWDAIRVSWDSPDFLIEDVWVTDARDDAVENDRLQSGTIRDSLFDGVFAGLSIDPSSSSPVDGSGETILLDGVLMRLELSLYEGQMTHGSFIKTDSATDGEVTPNLRFIDCVIAIEDVNHRSYRSMFDAWDHTIQSENNYFLNLSDEPLPDDYPMPPAGWTVLQGQEARDYWDAARDEWIAAHSDDSENTTVAPVENIFAEDDSNSGDEGTVISGTVAGNDSTTSGGALTFAVAADPGNGSVQMDADGTYSYTPDANFNGADSFTYTVTDSGSGEQKTQTVTISVAPVENIFAEDDSNSGDEGTVISGTVAGNDSTTSGGALTFAVAADPGNGSVQMDADGTYSYTPDANFNGADSFTYTVTDSGSGEQKTQTVTISVAPVENIFAEDDSNSGDEGTVISGTVAGNDSTTSGGALTFAVAADPGNGSVQMDADGTYSYTPDANFNGADSFTYTVTDSGSGEQKTQTVTIAVAPLDDESANDSFFAGDGGDWLLGDISGKVIYGRLRDDKIRGGTKDDVLFGEDGDDTMFGFRGDDSLAGGDRADFMDGGTGDDVLLGGNGDDVLIGGTGNDKLAGGDGDDILVGGAGNNVMAGGVGADEFQFTADSDGANSILDFDVFEDTLLLENVAAVSFKEVANGVTVELDNGGSITFVGLAEADMANVF